MSTTTPGPYRRVAVDESSAHADADGADDRGGGNDAVRRRGGGGSPSPAVKKSRSERISDKIHALVWVALAGSVAYFSNLPHVLLLDDRVNHPVLSVALAILGVNTVLTLYLAVYLPRCLGIDSSGWNAYCPRVIPVMTALGVLCAFLLVRATWPVWGFLAPLILGTVSLGGLFSLHFIPWC